MFELPIQPIACVVGHPIAGNPMQFAMERALAAADLDWRFLSLDVAPERFEDAFRGIDALGFQGASIASPHRTAAAALLDRLDPLARRAGWVDCIARDPAGRLVGHNLLARALAASVDLTALVNDGADPPTAVLLGETDHESAACHGLLDGPVAHWIVTDIDPAALQPHRSARLPAVDGDTERGASASAAEEAADALGAEAMRHAAGEANRPAASEATAAAAGETETPAPPQPAADSSPSVEQHASDHGSTPAGTEPTELPGDRLNNPLAAAVHQERVITRATSLDEAISEDTVLIIRGVMANGQPAKFPEDLLDRLDAPAMVVDMAVAASTSALVRAATQRGLQGITRLDLLIARTAMAMELWTGQPADTEILREAFEEYLEI